MKKDWEIKKLGEVFIIERGGSPRPIKKYLTTSNDGLNWIKISDASASNKYIYETKEKIVKEGLKKTRLVNEGDFILSNSMSFGRPYIMKTTGCIHDGWLVLRNKENFKINQNYLYYILCSPNIFYQFDILAAGSTVRNLNIALISSVKIPIPPLSVQERIVTILDEVFTSIETAKTNAEKNLQNGKEVFESSLNKIFTNPKENWEEKKLGEICETSAGGTPLKSHKEYYENGTIPWLRSGEVNNKNIITSELKITKLGLENSSAKLFPPETVLVAMYGATAGQVGILNFKCSTNQAVCGILPNSKLLPNFIYYALLGLKKSLISQAVGNAQPNISQEKIRNTKIPTPPLSEQKQIVEKLDKLKEETDKLEEIYTNKITKLEELKKSILNKAFEGEL